MRNMMVLLAVLCLTGAAQVAMAEPQPPVQPSPTSPQRIAQIEGDVLLQKQLLEERYKTEKMRSSNFQRLLALEEKKTAELSEEIKRIKSEYGAQLEAGNRELIGRVQAVCDHLAKMGLRSNGKERK